MTSFRSLATTFVVLATLGAAVACDSASGGPDEENSPSSLGSSAPAETEPTTSESAEPTEPTAIPTSYPEVGLEYVDLPELEGPHRAALETWIAFDRGRLQLMHEVGMNKLLTDNAVPEVVATWADTLDYLRANNARYRGETVSTVTDVTTSKGLLGLDVCLDGSALRWVQDGEVGPVPGSKPGGSPVRVIVTKTGEGWKVTEAGSQEGTC